MGRKHLLQLLKPNGTSVECTAEVMGSGLDLKNPSSLPNSSHQQPMFHFKFGSIRALRCVSEDSIELEVLNSQDGKTGKVKLRSPGPHGLAESPVQELHRELESAMADGIGQHGCDNPRATDAGRGGLSPRSGTYNRSSVEGLRSPSRLRHDSLSNAGDLNDHKWRDRQRRITSISSNDSLAIGHSKSRGASMMGFPPLSPCESPRDIGNGSQHRWPRLSLKSIDSSSNSAAESQHIAGNAKPVRSSHQSMEQGMFKGQDDSTYGSSCRTVIEHEASKSITMSGIQEHGGLLLESIAQQLCLRDGAPSSWHERRLSQCSTASTVSYRPKQQEDSSSELFPDEHSALDESAEAAKARKHTYPWAPAPHKYSNPLFNDSHQSNRSIGSDGSHKLPGVGHQPIAAAETDVMVIMHDHIGRDAPERRPGGEIAHPGSTNCLPNPAKPKWSTPNEHDRAHDVKDTDQGTGNDRPEEGVGAEDELLEALRLCEESVLCSMSESHRVSSSPVTARDKPSKPVTGSRQEASNERGVLSTALEKVNELLSSKREMEKELERGRKALQKAEQDAAKERQGRKTAENEAQDARQELTEVWGNLQQVKVQLLEAEQSAREADEACVAANEARAALKLELEASKRRIKHLQGSRGDEDSCHSSEGTADSRQDHAAVSRQVQLLRAELQMVDEAAAMAMEKARQEASRAEALEVELEQMRAFLNESSMRQSQSRQEDTDTLEMFCHSLQMQSPEAALDRGLSGTPGSASAKASGNRSSALPSGSHQKDVLGVMGLQELKDQMVARQHGDDVITELQSRLAASRRETRQLQAAQQASEEALEDARADADKCRQRVSRMQERMEAMTWQAEEAKEVAAEAREQAAAGKSAAARAEQQAGKLQQRLRTSEAAAKHAERVAAKAAESLRQEAHKLTVRLEESRELLEVEEQERLRAVEEIKRLKAALRAAQESRGGQQQQQPVHGSSKARSTKEVDLAVAQRNSAREEANLLRKRLEKAEAERLRMEAEMGELKHLRRLLKESGATIRAAAAAQSSAEGMARELEGRLRTVYTQVGWGPTASSGPSAAKGGSIDWGEQEPDSTIMEVGDAAVTDYESYAESGRHQHAVGHIGGKSSSSSNRGSRTSRHSSSTDNLPMMQHEGGRHQQAAHRHHPVAAANDTSWVTGGNV